jgi:outer membrane receptor protein involved in Fe transport
LRYDANAPKWNVTAYVHNVTDKRVLSTGSYNTNGLITGAYQPPRTFGAIFGIKF